jgi:predicted enzyme related to lactoylglutathione lyase
VSTYSLVHLELHTGNLPRACEFYARLFGWRSETIDGGCGKYQVLGLAGPIGGGVTECGTERPLWLPYFEVPDIGEATERARRLGATVKLDSREGPAGWRSVLASPAGGEVALWRPKSTDP